MSETLLLDGVLGSVHTFPDGGIVLYPLTLFAGKQGTGKSLVSQIVYFFRNLPFLGDFYTALAEKSLEVVATAALDEMRGKRRSFAASFASPTAHITYIREGVEMGIKIDGRGRRVKLSGKSGEKTAEILKSKGGTPLGHALYIPAERMFYSHARGVTPWKVMSMPFTLEQFATVMEIAGETHKTWKDGKPDTKEGMWVHCIGRQALRGEAVRVGEHWEWNCGDKRLAIDMASSGQKSAWPIVVLAEVLFSWRRDRKIPPDFALHVEEPEAHLHPEAQVAMVKILAYLVNHGFRVLITTHSLIVLYALNNLLAASALPEGLTEPGVPEPEVRLRPGMAGMYFFGEDGIVKNLVDAETGIISEAELAETGERLITELNRIEVLDAYGY